MSTCKIDVSSWDPYQHEIKFFWPLTEQIPLDLDFTLSEAYVKDKQQSLLSGMNGAFLVSAGTGLTFAVPDSTWTTVSINGSQLNLDVEEIEFKVNKKPNLLRRLAYKIMGLKWKVK
jgi:hypothetical protein